MSIRRIAPLAIPAALLLASCGSSLDREGSIDELVESGLSRPVAECVIDTSVDEFGEDRVISDDDPTPEEEARIGEILFECMDSAG